MAMWGSNKKRAAAEDFRTVAKDAQRSTRQLRNALDDLIESRDLAEEQRKARREAEQGRHLIGCTVCDREWYGTGPAAQNCGRH